VAVLRGLETLLRTAVALLVLPVLIFLACVVGIGWVLAGATPAGVHCLYVGVARACLIVGGTRLVVHGVERIEPGQAYVVVPNHESGWDPLCLLVGLPRLVIRFVAKQEFMRIPVLGHALRLSGNIRVLRTDTPGDVARIRLGMDRRDPAVSILFFAEGTRSRDGALHPFKAGAFATAIGYGLPILPIGLSGTRHIWERSIVRLRRGTVTIEVGAPIPVEGLRMEDRHRLRDSTFAAVADLRARARQHLRSLGVDPGGIDAVKQRPRAS
jgi:1-acyl-sn-glycerol-3-phosphate acyltransferase